MVFNVFPHSSAGEGPFYLMFGCNPFMPTLGNVLRPQHRYMGDEKGRIHLNAMWEIYMMAILNLKTVRDKCPTPIRDLDKTDFKVEDMVLIKNHTPKGAFDSK